MAWASGLSSKRPVLTARFAFQRLSEFIPWASERAGEEREPERNRLPGGRKGPAAWGSETRVWVLGFSRPLRDFSVGETKKYVRCKEETKFEIILVLD